MEVSETYTEYVSPYQDGTFYVFLTPFRIA